MSIDKLKELRIDCVDTLEHIDQAVSECELRILDILKRYSGPGISDAEARLTLMLSSLSLHLMELKLSTQRDDATIEGSRHLITQFNKRVDDIQKRYELLTKR